MGDSGPSPDVAAQGGQDPEVASAQPLLDRPHPNKLATALREHQIQDDDSFDTTGNVNSPFGSTTGDSLLGTASASGGNLLACIVILSKTILGAGMTALPRAFSLLGLLLATAMLVAVGYLTHLSLIYLIRASVRTGRMSYPDVTTAVLGRAASIILQVTLVARCFGLMLVYMIVAGDILAGGGKGYPGLACDLAGAEAGSWCSSRPFIITAVTILAFAPLCSFKHITSAAATSYLGMLAVTIWAISTLVLLAAAVRQGAVKGRDLLPDLDAFGGGIGPATLQILGIVPILATAYTCQMTIHFVAADLRPFSEERVAALSGWAISVCALLFFVVAAASYAIFGADVHGDVLINLTKSATTQLVGRLAGAIIYYAIRIGFLVSVITIFPMQMQPYRESFMKLVFGRELTGWWWIAVTYGSLALILIPGVLLRSVWGPLQLIGATAGAVIAFWMPAVIALQGVRQAGAVSHARATWAGACTLLVVGVLQCIAGVVVTFKPP